uniref:DNA mismatch repair protein MutL containing n=1 Tax=Haemonchus contortus TaxID=6289 RepID=W6NFN8_HAECO
MGEEKVQWLLVVRDLLVPRIKSHLLPPKSLSDAVVCLADLHDLYKVFERLDVAISSRYCTNQQLVSIPAPRRFFSHHIVYILRYFISKPFVTFFFKIRLFSLFFSISAQF